MDKLEIEKILVKNKILKEENKALRKILGFKESKEDIVNKVKNGVTNKSSVDDKISLYLSLFKGRRDVFAKRWENKYGKSGYSPVCLNEWKKGICIKPQSKCNKCNNRVLKILTRDDIYNHLAGIQLYFINVELLDIK